MDYDLEDILWSLGIDLDTGTIHFIEGCGEGETIIPLLSLGDDSGLKQALIVCETYQEAYSVLKQEWTLEPGTYFAHGDKEDTNVEIPTQLELRLHNECVDLYFQDLSTERPPLIIAYTHTLAYLNLTIYLLDEEDTGERISQYFAEAPHGFTQIGKIQTDQKSELRYINAQLRLHLGERDRRKPSALMGDLVEDLKGLNYKIGGNNLRFVTYFQGQSYRPPAPVQDDYLLGKLLKLKNL